MAQVDVLPELRLLDVCYSKAACYSVHKNWKEGIRLTQGHLEMIEDLLPQSCTVGNLEVQRSLLEEKSSGQEQWGGALCTYVGQTYAQS